MRLTRLSLTDFRSYPSAELHPDPGPDDRGRPERRRQDQPARGGPRRHHRPLASRRRPITSWCATGSRSRACGWTWPRSDGGPPAAIELVLPGEAAPAEIRKRLTVNGVPRRASSVSETARSVLFRPEEMLLLIGAPSERRRFLDAILAQRDRRAARDLAELVRVLAQRNALLRAIRREEATDDGLGFWDEQLAQVGARVMAARLRLVGELGERIPALHDAVAPPDEGDASVRLTYLDTLKDAWPERPAGADDPEALVPAFRRRIADARQKELWNGVSLVGPQRDDLRVALGGRDVATHASRGQQRTIIVALKLAERDLLGADDAPAPDRAAGRRVQRARPRPRRADAGPAARARPGAGHDRRPGAAARRPAPARAGLAGGRGELRRSPRVA